MASLEGFARWVRRCNTFTSDKHLLPFRCEQQCVGYIKPSFAKQLARFEKTFKVGDGEVCLRVDTASPEDRSTAVAEVLEILREEKVVTGWRNELYPVTSEFRKEPVLLLERAAAVQFGIKSYGVHMNGYVKSSSGELKLWVAKRSKDKPTWPGKLDHLCAGGQPYGISPGENMVKECAEEASIPDQLARQCKPAGAVSYSQLQESGLKRDCLFVYDLELPADFEPQPGDGEVESFSLMDIHDVATIISDTDHFKDNCNLVIIDFMIRHGVLKPESPGYLELLSGLRQGDCL